MAYDPNVVQPAILAQGLEGSGKIFVYKSDDAPAAVRAAGYFTDGWDLGMRAGDMVMVVDESASPITMQIMIVTSATAAAGVDLSDGTAVTATDSD